MNPHVLKAIITTTSEGTQVVKVFPGSDEPNPLVAEIRAALAARFGRVPVLDLGEGIGHTGYLDFVTPAMMTAPVMVGVDSAGRPFIALRYWARGLERVEVLFQRYAGDGQTWTSGGASLVCGGALDQQDTEWACRLIAGGAKERNSRYFKAGEEVILPLDAERVRRRGFPGGGVAVHFESGQVCLV
jgi:hypothetical protein